MSSKAAAPAHSNEQQSHEVSQGWKDVIFGVAFYVHVAGIGYVAYKYKDDVDFNKQPSEESNDFDARVLYTSIAAMITTLGFGFAWMNVLKRYSSGIIRFCLLASVAMTIVLGLFAMVANPIFGVVFLFFAGLQALYYYFVRRRIAFTSVLLEICIEIIKKYNGSIFIALGVQVVSIVWLFVWNYGAIGVSIALNQNSDSENVNVSSGIGFLLLVSLFWTINVLSNLVLVTVAGVAATWYFNTEARNVTSDSLKRALTTSFGSIAFGSLIISIINALKVLIRAQSDDMPEIARCIIMCIVSCIEAIAEFITKYAFVHVGIYGDDFIGAAKKTWELLMSRGFDVLVNDDLSGLALGFSAFVGGAVSGIVGGLVALALGLNSNSTILAMVLAFFLGFAVMSVMMSVLDSGVATLMVLWADDPAALQANHQHLHLKLNDAVRSMYPSVHLI